MSGKNHAIDYLEFPLVEYEATKSFYPEVFGWEFQDWGPDYMCFVGAGINLGFNRSLQPAAATNGVLVVIFAEDLEQTEAAVLAAGGKILRETFEFPGGRRFQFADPNGNELGVWTPTEQQ